MIDDIQQVLDILKEMTIYRLSLCDGCMCGGFELRGITVQISCGKGGRRAVWVSPDHNGDFEDEDPLLTPILKEVISQVMEADGRGEMSGFLHPWNREDN